MSSRLPRPSWIGVILWLGVSSLLTAAEPEGGAEPSPLVRYTASDRQMGVDFHITVYAPSEEAANEGVAAVWQRIGELNRLFSDYEPTSELMRFCRRDDPTEPMAVSPELYEVLQTGRRISEASDGAFDVSVGPVVKLWRKARRTKQLPPAEELAAALRLVDYRGVELHADRRVALRPGMQLDLGGIAKGYAAEAGLDVLRRMNLPRAMVAGSGDIVVGDPPPGQPGWRIGIAPLTKPDDPPSRHVVLKNAAIATSGDAFQFVEIDGVRYSHIVDPRTGLGVTRRSSVTVVAPDGATADALATAISVLGPDGLRILEKFKGTAGLAVELVNSQPVVRETAGFRKLVDEGE